MSNVITMDEFNESKSDATNLTEDERSDADMESAMEKSWDLLDLIGTETNHDTRTLYFTFCNIAEVLIEHGGWSADELTDSIHQAQKDIESEVKG